MSIEMSRIMAHVVVVSIFLMALGFVGATLVAFARLMFLGSEFLRGTETSALIYAVGANVPNQSATLPKRRLLNGRKGKKIMAVLNGSFMIPSWAPTMSKKEQESLTIPAYLRQPLYRQAHKVPSIADIVARRSDSMIVVNSEQQVPVTVSQPVAVQTQVNSEDLFDKKDIFKLDPEPAS